MSPVAEREPALIAAEAALVKAADKGSLLPVFRGQEMADAMLAYRDLQAALDRAMPDQIIEIHGRPFRKKGYWRAVARAFKVNLECTRETSTETGWLVVYRATSPNGQYAEGDGACESDEKADGQDTEHNVRSHAHTRAFNRAVSNLVGFGEVSAEEVQRTGKRDYYNVQNTAPAPTNLPEGAVVIRDVRLTPTKNKNLKKAFVVLSDGREPSTINEKLIALCEQLSQDNIPVSVEVSDQGKWGLQLEAVKAIADGPAPVASREPLTAEHIPF